MSLLKKTTVWVQEQIITPEQKEKILAFERQSGNHTFWNTAFIIAGILIGLGICLLIAANWSVLPATVKLIGDFALFGALIFAIYWSIQNQHKGLKELFTILAFLLVGGTIGLVGQIFQLSGGWNNFALAWALLGLPYVILSRSIFINMAWLVLLGSIFNGKYLGKILEYIVGNFTINTIIDIIILYAIYWGITKIQDKTDKYIVLPKTIGKLLIWSIYLLVIYIGCRWGLISSHNLQAFGAYLVVFGFLGFRMYMATRKQNISSFKRNAVLAEIYIFAIFASKMGNLWMSGWGFILGGLFILAFVFALRKTTRYIKQMEIFK
ncbi:MAG: DUF2157 domain-containing protein [Elusimicrobiaceae bacterium]|nr:DUF2157 domain-containing protein [Elusimicrobiaceae bacterium]